MPNRDVDDTILRHLATHPFLSAADLGVRWGVATGTMARALARLRDAGLIERVPQGDDKTFLYVPTGDGAIAAAASTGGTLGSFCRIYGLDRCQLLARLPLLKRLVYAQRFVMELDTSDFKISGCRWTAAGVSFSFYSGVLRRGRWPARTARGTRHRNWTA